MQKELQFTLSIIGILIIGGVLLHGMWTIRKNSKKQKKARFESRNWEPGFEEEAGFDDEGPLYDNVGVGKARVVINPKGSSQENDSAEIEPIAVDEPEALQTQNIEEEALLPDTSPIQVTNTDDTLSGDIVSANPSGGFSEVEMDFGADENVNNTDSSNAQVVVVKDESEIDSSLAFSNESAEHVAKNEKSSNIQEPSRKIEAPIYSNVVTQPKPEFVKSSVNINDDAFGQPPGFLLKKQDADESIHEQTSAFDNNSVNPDLITTPKAVEPIPTNTIELVAPDFSLNIQEGLQAPRQRVEEPPEKEMEKELSFAEQAKRFVRRNKKPVPEKIKKEPVLKGKTAENQMKMDFDESQGAKTSLDQTSKVKEGVKPQSSVKSNSGETDVLVLNVRAADDKPINGASLLPMLLTLGFKFGEHDIFHRHVSTNGKGPILFSLTNMFKPGVFDIDNIENFNTFGLSLFMMLPIDADPQQVFNMMHNASRKLSEEFGCRILDSNKVALSKQSLQQYIERIREFERKRLST